MFKKLRIAVLVYLLLFVAAGNYLALRRSTDWDDTLWVDVYPFDATGSQPTRAYVDELGDDSLRPIEDFFAEQAGVYGIGLERPFRLMLREAPEDAPPAMPVQPGWLAAIVWSLEMRWYTLRLNWRSEDPTPDIVIYARYHDADSTAVIERSGALRKGLIADVNLFAAPSMRGSNQVILAHELLHTVGATDKYDPTTNQPLYPIGYAEPHRSPLYPQRAAELMGGRIPLSAHEAVTPSSLSRVVIGPETALEIGWLDELPAQRAH